MNILVITREAWANTNSVGNTMTTLFEPLSSKNNIYNLFFRESNPDNSVAKIAFRISEYQILNKLLKRGVCGEIVDDNKNTSHYQTQEKRMYSSAKRMGSFLPHFAREFLWSTNVWKNKELNDYIDSIRPDVVFMPVFPCWYAHRVLQYIYNRTGAKIILFHADDCYSLKQFSLYPSFWLYRFIQRKFIKKSVEISKTNFVISPLQKEEYDKSFGISSHILTKYYDFKNMSIREYRTHKPINIVYTGNLNLNRWKTISLLVNALKEINCKDIHYTLFIYSGTCISSKIQSQIADDRFSFFMGSVDSDEVKHVQNNADILLHVEAFDIKNKLRVRQSFSTKIVDYFYQGRAILAIGPKDVASIKYLQDNDCAFVCSNKKELISMLNTISNTPSSIGHVADNAIIVGKKNHDISVMQELLKTEFEK